MNEKTNMKKRLLKNMLINFVVFTVLFLIFDLIIYFQVSNSLYKSIDQELMSTQERYPKNENINISRQINNKGKQSSPEDTPNNTIPRK